jgi:hypothetical protein
MSWRIVIGLGFGSTLVFGMENKRSYKERGFGDHCAAYYKEKVYQFLLL